MPTLVWFDDKWI